MVTIQIDEQTASALERKAQAAGVSLVEYLRQLMLTDSAGNRSDWQTLEQGFEELSFDGPSLPADFSRADAYIDHD